MAEVRSRTWPPAVLVDELDQMVLDGWGPLSINELGSFCNSYTANLTFLLLALSQPHAGAAAIFVDGLRAARFSPIEIVYKIPVRSADLQSVIAIT